MRIEDVFSYQQPEQLNEAPYGLGQRAMDKVASVASNGARGRRESGQKANQLFKQFKNFAGQAGYRGKSSIPGEELANFLSSEGYDSSKIDTSKNFTIKSSADAIMSAVQQSAKSGVKSQATAKRPQDQQAQQQTQQAAPTKQAPAKEPVQQEPEAPEQSQPEQSAAPQGVYADISKLSDSDREQLIKYLQKNR